MSPSWAETRAATPATVAWLLAIVLLASAVAKLADPSASLDAVAGFLGEGPAGTLTAAGVVGAEVVSGVLLLVPATRRHGLAASAALFGAFAAFLLAKAAAGLESPCGCFGALDLGVPLPAHVALDLGAALAATLARCRTG